MPILRLLERQGFDPEAVNVLVTAFERARDQLDPSDRLNPLLVELVAQLTIDFAKQGERDPARLSELIFDALMMAPQARSAGEDFSLPALPPLRQTAR